MAERIPQSASYLVVFRAFLASDGKTPATGKTIAITISKNGATSFSNPNAGATNATEMASGYYKFTLDATDTNTLGPIAWRGAEGTINDAGDVLTVASANNAGFAALPDTACTTNASLITAGTGTSQLAVSGGAVTTVTTLTNLPAITAGWLTATGIADDAITAAKIANAAIDTATFATGCTIPRVTLADTLTTYTGNTPQTGDAYAGLANLATPAQVYSQCAQAIVDADFGTIGEYIDATWDELEADHQAAGSTGLALSAASGAVTLASNGLDSVLIESSITAGANLVNDTGTQLTSINAKQAIALCVSALAGVLSGADSGSTQLEFAPAGLPTANPRIDATVTSRGNRTSIQLRVPN